MIDDGALVLAAQAGDRLAFEALVRRHTPALYRLCLRLLGQPADAEDAVQEVWVRAWRNLPGFRAEAAVGTWLYRMAVNQCVSRQRAARPMVPLDEDTPSTGSVAGAAERSAAAHAVRAAVLALPGDQRSALVLREFEGRSYDEIATMLGISLSAVKSRLHRARLELARMLREWR